MLSDDPCTLEKLFTSYDIIIKSSDELSNQVKNIGIPKADNTITQYFLKISYE